MVLEVARFVVAEPVKPMIRSSYHGVYLTKIDTIVIGSMGALGEEN